MWRCMTRRRSTTANRAHGVFPRAALSPRATTRPVPPPSACLTLQVLTQGTFKPSVIFYPFLSISRKLQWVSDYLFSFSGFFSFPQIIYFNYDGKFQILLITKYFFPPNINPILKPSVMLHTLIYIFWSLIVSFIITIIIQSKPPVFHKLRAHPLLLS